MASFSVDASVVMQGNRVIFDPSLSKQTIKFTNNDNFPYIVQAWVSTTKTDKFSNDDKTPFIVSPAIFKIQQLQDQIISLINTEPGNKPQSEKIYYLHFTQIPSVSTRDQSKNKLVLILNSIVKIFLRPQDLSIDHDSMFNFINYEIVKGTTGCIFTINNKSPYYLNSILLTLNYGTEKKDFPITMIYPNSAFTLKENCNTFTKSTTVTMSFVNDYGVIQHYNLKG